ncbi:hypothetical protein B7R87_31640 [Streptomyces tsukubensis]|nr:hypothetical protein B7R87_31640 [Streptomyces tsukubensis]
MPGGPGGAPAAVRRGPRPPSTEAVPTAGPRGEFIMWLLPSAVGPELLRPGADSGRPAAAAATPGGWQAVPPQPAATGSCATERRRTGGTDPLAARCPAAFGQTLRLVHTFGRSEDVPRRHPARSGRALPDRILNSRPHLCT